MRRYITAGVKFLWFVVRKFALLALHFIAHRKANGIELRRTALHVVANSFAFGGEQINLLLRALLLVGSK